jgi:putative transcriptional regulator
VSRIANRIRERRAAHAGLTQELLAHRVDVTRQTIIALEAGKYAPSLELAFRLAHALKVPITELFTYDPG